MTEKCRNCNNEDGNGILKDQRTIICLDCGYCTGDRRGKSLRHHEGRIKRVRLLVNELEKFNTNIREQDKVEKVDRILSLIRLETDYYMEWVGEEADIESMRDDSTQWRRGKRPWLNSDNTWSRK